MMAMTTIQRLRWKCKGLGITHSRIARRARVDRTLVTHFFAERTKSPRVLWAAHALIAEAEARLLGVGPRRARR